MIKSLYISAALLALSATSFADDKAEIKKQYDNLVKAIKAKDIKGMMAIGTKDMVWVDSSGRKMTSSEVEKTMKTQFAQPFTIQSVKVELGKFTKQGSAYVVNNKMSMSGSFKMPASAPKGSDSQPKAKAMKIESISEGQDTWVKQGGKWLVKKIVNTKEKTLVDGKDASTMRSGG